MRKIVELAPAKVNLYLKVLRKRPDGYHDIETLFERINIFDRVTVEPRKEGIEIKSSDPSIPTGKGSLMFRAVELLKRKTKSGISIKIKKNIPVAAGLGGGSSDAASVLKALNKLWGLGLGKEKLMEKARVLGADVPFFLAESSFAIGSERGDILTPISCRKAYWHFIVYPNIKILSGEIYKLYGQMHSLTLTRENKVDKILTPSVNIDDINVLNRLVHNELENIVLSREPIIRDIKNTLEKENGNTALVSGSGPSVFSIHRTRKEACRAKEIIVKRFSRSKEWRMFIAKTY